MGNERMTEIVRRYGPERLIVDSACDWGVSDPLAVPKTARLMAERGIDPAAIRAVTYANALAAYGLNGEMREEHWTRSGADRPAHALPGQLGAARRAGAGHPRAGRSGGRAADRLSGLASAAARCRVRRSADALPALATTRRSASSSAGRWWRR